MLGVFRCCTFSGSVVLFVVPFLLIRIPYLLVLLGPPHMAKKKQDDQFEHTYSSYVRIRDVALKTCQRR